MFREALEHRDNQVLRLESGVKGMQIATEREFDAIFFDLDIADIDGIEALRFMRAVGVRAPITFISSDRTSPALMLAARDGLGFDVLRRPLTAQLISQLLEEMTRLE